MRPKLPHLEFPDCPHYQRYAAGAQPAEQAYARYLQVQHTAQDVVLLPKAQQDMARQVLAGQAGQSAPAAEAALSQLTAAGVAVRAGHLELAGVQQAVQLASAQGWRRSVMAWLLLEQRLHQAAGNAAGVQAVELACRCYRMPKLLVRKSERFALYFQCFQLAMALK